MKKIIYTLLIAFSSALVFTACTEEEVAPATQTSNTGALESDFVKKWVPKHANSTIMKLRIILLLGAVALVTLSFTFSNPSSSQNTDTANAQTTTAAVYDVGFIGDEVVK